MLSIIDKNLTKNIMAIKYYCNLCRFYDSENNTCSIKKQAPVFDNEECESYCEKSFIEDMPLDGRHANVLTSDSMRSFEAIAKWLKILSILGFIGVGLGLFMAISMIMIPIFGSTSVRFGLGVLIFSSIIGILNCCLFKAGKKIKSAINNDSPEEMEDGLDKLSKYINYQGVLMIIMLVGGFVSLLISFIIPIIYFLSI